MTRFPEDHVVIPEMGSARPYSYRDDASVPAFPDDRPVIVFDGMCVLCSETARFVMRHDGTKVFRLLAAQSPLGRALYVHYGLDADVYDTFIVITGGRAWFRSSAALKIAEGLGPPWSLAGLFRVVPLAVRDGVYNLVARNRFRMFGRRESCARPGPGDANRFLA